MLLETQRIYEYSLEIAQVVVIRGSVDRLANGKIQRRKQLCCIWAVHFIGEDKAKVTAVYVLKNGAIFPTKLSLKILQALILRV